MRYAIEKASRALFEEVLPLAQLHHDEIAPFKDIPLDPDWDTYERMEQQGMLRIFTARGDDGTLVGYACWVVTANPHYRRNLYALCDVLFVKPGYRGAYIGAGLLRACEKRLVEEGVSVAYIHFQAGHDQRRLMQRQGYELKEFNYGKRLEVAS